MLNEPTNGLLNHGLVLSWILDLSNDYGPQHQLAQNAPTLTLKIAEKFPSFF